MDLKGVFVLVPTFHWIGYRKIWNGLSSSRYTSESPFNYFIDLLSNNSRYNSYDKLNEAGSVQFDSCVKNVNYASNLLGYRVCTMRPNIAISALSPCTLLNSFYFFWLSWSFILRIYNHNLPTMKPASVDK